MVDLLPGEHVIMLVSPSQIDCAGIEARRKGLEVRDCLNIQLAGSRLFGLLLREPIASSSSEQCVRTGRGFLDIDACRIGNTTRTNSSKPRAERNGFIKGFVSGTETEIKNHGRWPTNLIFVHGPDCECVGTKKISGTAAGKMKGKIDGSSTYGLPFLSLAIDSLHLWSEETRTGFADDDGKEEVADWNCQPDCPVRLLDLQSGVLKSGYLSPQHNVKATTGWSGGSQADRVKQTFESNSGGASRFFYQAQTEDELDAYLSALIRGDRVERYDDDLE